MFRAFKCPSSGENSCIYATLVFVTLKGGSFILQRLLLHKIGCWVASTYFIQ